MILTGIQADKKRLDDIATDLNERKTDLNRWKAAYNTKKATDCVDADGNNSAFYQGKINSFASITYAGEPTYTGW